MWRSGFVVLCLAQCALSQNLDPIHEIKRDLYFNVKMPEKFKKYNLFDINLADEFEFTLEHCGMEMCANYEGVVIDVEKKCPKIMFDPYGVDPFRLLRKAIEPEKVRFFGPLEGIINIFVLVVSRKSAPLLGCSAR